MKVFTTTIALSFIILFTTSCQLFRSGVEKNRLAKIESDKIITELNEAKEKVEKQVRLVKANIKDEAKLNELNAEYTSAQEAFNKTYDKIIGKIQEPSVGQMTCVIFKYKRVIAPSNDELKKDAELADKFIKDSNTALNIGGAGVGIVAVLNVVAGVFKEFKKARINTCKSEIEKLKYKSWKDIS